jgi:tight adherence protein B
MELLEMLIFFAVSLGIVAGAFVWSELARRDELRGVRRLSEQLAKPPPSAGPTKPLFKNLDEVEAVTKVLPEEPAGLSPEDAFAEADPPDVGPSPPLVTRLRTRLRDALERADLRMQPRIFLAICAFVAFMQFNAGWLLMGALLAVPAGAVGAVLPWLYLRYRLNRRRERLLRQLPTAFDLMARVLRSGLSMPQAFQSVADAFEPPLSNELARVRDEQNLGMLPEVSLRGMAERTGVLEVKIFVMAMLIQQQTGGNLSEVLERLGGLVRDRLRLRGLVKTLTAEGRLQATVLLVLPVVIFLAIRFINRPYTDVLLSHPVWLAVTAVLMAFGALWIRKVIDIE